MLRVVLANGYAIESGWSDVHDPDALPAGDWLSLSDRDGTQLVYIDMADVAGNPRALREAIHKLLSAAAGGT